MTIKFGPMLRQVWQGWWEVVDVDTGNVLFRSWVEEAARRFYEKHRGGGDG